MYLMIENPGVADPTSFTLFGASTKRGSSAIGQFGTGGKQAVALLLRKGIGPTICCGNLKMGFDSEPVESNGQVFNQVIVRYSGKDQTGKTRNNKESLSFVVENGAIDWDREFMAMREFVSNAIDSVESNQVNQINIEIVASIRAKAGYTRVFIPVNNAVRHFHANLGKFFLHFSEPESLKKAVLDKTDRNMDTLNHAVIYRRGVYVREIIRGEKSLFDYNLDDLPMDESRRVDDYSAASYAALALAGATDTQYAKLLKNCGHDEQCWEAGFNRFMLNLNKEKLHLMFGHYFEPNIIFCSADEAQFVAAKGYRPVILTTAYLEEVTSAGLNTVKTIFSEDERNGRVIIPATAQAQIALNHVWDILSLLGMTYSKNKPDLKCFQQQSSGGAVMNGYYKMGGGTIYINESIAPNVAATPSQLSTDLLSTTFEECIHYLTEAKDFTCDFQNFAIEALVRCSR